MIEGIVNTANISISDSTEWHDGWGHMLRHSAWCHRSRGLNSSDVIANRLYLPSLRLLFVLCLWTWHRIFARRWFSTRPHGLLTCACFNHIRRFRAIRRTDDAPSFATLVHALVCCRPDSGELALYWYPRGGVHSTLIRHALDRQARFWGNCDHMTAVLYWLSYPARSRSHILRTVALRLNWEATYCLSGPWGITP